MCVCVCVCVCIYSGKMEINPTAGEYWNMKNKEMYSDVFISK